MPSPGDTQIQYNRIYSYFVPAGASSQGTWILAGHGTGGGDGSLASPLPPGIQSALPAVDIAAGLLLDMRTSGANEGKLVLGNSSNLDEARIVGMATTSATVASGDEVEYSPDGLVTLSDWTAVIGSPNLESGKVYFLTTNGQMSTTAPTTGFLVQVGTAQDQFSFSVDIKAPYGLNP